MTSLGMMVGSEDGRNTIPSD